MDLISLLFEKKVIALLSFTILSIILAIIITLRQRPKKPKEEKEITPEEKLLRILKNKTPEEKLQLMSNFSKEFFNQKYNINKKLDFYEIEKSFDKNPEVAKFCQMIIEAYYSGEKVNEKLIESIEQKLLSIIAVPKVQEVKHEKKLFSFVKKEKKHKIINPKYYASETAKQIPIPPKKDQKKSQKLEVESTKNIFEQNQTKIKVRQGRDHENNVSFFTHKEDAAKAKSHIGEAKSSMKKIHSSLENSKDNSIKDNLFVSEFNEAVKDIKSKVSESYKNIISKL